MRRKTTARVMKIMVGKASRMEPTCVVVWGLGGRGAGGEAVVGPGGVEGEGDKEGDGAGG